MEESLYFIYQCNLSNFIHGIAEQKTQIVTQIDRYQPVTPV